MSAEPLTEQIMVRLTPTMLAALGAEAATQQRTVANLVRLALAQYLAQQAPGLPSHPGRKMSPAVPTKGERQ